MNNRKTINDILAKWGRERQKSPENNLELKSRILERAPNATYQPRAKTPWPWFSIACVSLAVLVIFINSASRSGVLTSVSKVGNKNYNYTNSISEPTFPAQNDIAYKESFQILPNYGGSPGLPISDNREFLKTYYNATIQTRKVSDLKTKIEITVRGLGGRLDSSSASDESGYITFAVPADKFEAMRMELKNMVWGKLYIENLSSENLLPEKQSIEEQERQNEKIVADLKSDRGNLVKNHNQTVYSYKSRINSLNQEKIVLQNEWPTATGARQAQISARFLQIEKEINILEGQISTENKNYQNSLATLDANIKSAEGGLRYIYEQDQNLLNNVATVNGTIYLSGINWWQLIDIYVPGPLLAWTLIFVGLGAYIYQRRRYLEVAF